MDPAQFLAASQVIIVAGKGGVGKTTVSAALGRAGASVGLSTLIVEVEGKSGLPSLFGRDGLGYEEDVLAEADPATGAAELRARALTPDDALIEYLHDHGMQRISKRLVSSGALDMVATAAPGIRDILILGKVKQLQQSGRFDLIVLDAPAAGHAISFLRSARGLLDAVQVGPIHAQARDVIELLTDPARCSVMLVTLPEETPVNELIQTAYSLEEDVGVNLGPVFVNALYPLIEGLDTDPTDAARSAGASLRPGEAEALAAAAAFRRERTALQREQLSRLSSQLPLAQVHLPELFSTALGSDAVVALADAVCEQVSNMAMEVALPGHAAVAEGGPR